MSLGAGGNFERLGGACARAGPAFLIGFALRDELIFEFSNETLHRPRARFSEGTDCAPTRDVVRNLEEVIGIHGAALTVRHAMERFGHPQGTFTARGALAAAFVRVEFGQVGERFHNVHGIIHHNNGTRTRHGPSRHQGIEVVGKVEHIQFLLDIFAIGALFLEPKFFTGLEYFRRAATWDNGLEFAALAETSAKIVLENEFADGCLADFDLVVAWLFNLAAQADDAGACVIGHAELRIFGSSHADDVPNGGERLDVIDDRRAHVEAQDRREIRRLDLRIGGLAFQGFDEAGFFATDVCPSPTVHGNFEFVAGAEDVLSEKTIRACLFESAIED